MNIDKKNIIIALLVAILIVISINTFHKREQTVGEKLDAAIEHVKDAAKDINDK